MKYEELVERVGWGEEFPFYYKGEQYWISQNTEGYYLTRVSDSYSQQFKTADNLFQNGRIEGKSILEIWEHIQEYF